VVEHKLVVLNRPRPRLLYPGKGFYGAWRRLNLDDLRRRAGGGRVGLGHSQGSGQGLFAGCAIHRRVKHPLFLSHPGGEDSSGGFGRVFRAEGDVSRSDRVESVVAGILVSGFGL